MNRFRNFELDFNERNLLIRFKRYRNLYNLNNKIKSLNKCNLIFISKDVKTDSKNNADYSEIKIY